jgi:hypothetical protein
MNNDTPRTDEILMQCPSHLQEVALANLAQDLERELAHSLANQLKTQAELERLKRDLQSTEAALQQMTQDAIKAIYGD